MAHKILAVDDEPDVLLVIKAGLQTEGFEVVTASDGEQALEVAKAEKPDLVVLDVMMPKLDGFSVLAKMKEDDDLAQIPVIMLTGVADREKIRDALSGGSDFYIVKPFEYEELVQKIRTALNQGGFSPAL